MSREGGKETVRHGNHAHGGAIVASPVPVDAVDEKPEELVSGSEARTALATEGDLELLAEEQVLELEALAAAQGIGQSGYEQRRSSIIGQDRRSSPLRGAGRRLLPPNTPWRSVLATRSRSPQSRSSRTPLHHRLPRRQAS